MFLVIIKTPYFGMFSEYLHFGFSSDCRDEARFLSKDII